MLKEVLKTAEEQQKRISELEKSQQLAKERIIRNSNNIYEVPEVGGRGKVFPQALLDYQQHGL